MEVIGKEDIRKLYGVTIFKDSYRSCIKPLDPNDIRLTPIEAYKGLSRLNNSLPSSIYFLWGALIALIAISLLLK